MAVMRRDWKAKVASLIIAIAVWYVIKEQEGTPPPAGGGSSFYEEPRMIFEDLFANQPTLSIEEPSWYLCGNYVNRLIVFDPAPRSGDLA